MRFVERKQWLYDPELFKRMDVQLALKLNAEYTSRHSAQPLPIFMEVDHSSTKTDALWHMPLSPQTQYARKINLAAIVTTERPDWRLTKLGIVPTQKHKVWLSHNLLLEADYFPQRGDMMLYNGYRNMIINVVLDPNAFWQQTNVWTSLQVETIIPADGDARPTPTGALPTPAELPGAPGQITMV